MRLPSLLLPLILAGLFLAQGQEFGQNKVQTRAQDWLRTRTAHFEVHFERHARILGTFAAQHADRMYDSLSARLGYGFKGRVPVILYSSPSEFQNTNIVPVLLPEGVGGFTEVFRNRVVLPFDGSYPRLHHVLQHEFVHAFMFEMFDEGDRGVEVLLGGTPLWFSEGLAEYLSLGWDLESDMFLADAVASGMVQNPARGLPGFLAYKGGQSFFAYLAHAFGPEVIPRLVNALRRTGDLRRAFRAVTGAELEEVGELWLRELRSIYWPELSKRQSPLVLARQLTRHREDASNFNLQPALSPDGKRLAFFSDRDPYVSLVLADAATGRRIRTLASSGGERGHASFYPRESRPSWSPDGRRIAFVSKTVGRDVIRIVAADGWGAETISPPGITGINSPSWSPDGSRLVFSGMRDGLTDLYIWDLREERLTQLTRDVARDAHPVFSPSGRWIAFESDRPQPTLPWNERDPFAGIALLRHSDIYRIPAEGGVPVLAAGGPYDETWPAFGPEDSLLAFVSNRSGLPNAYIASEGPEGWTAAPVTNLLSAVSSPSWQAGKLAFSLFHNGGWDVYLLEDPLGSRRESPLPRTVYMQTLEDPSRRFFSPFPPLRNLTTFEPDAVADSLARQRLQFLADRGDRADTTGAGSVPTPPPALPLPRGALDTVGEYRLDWGMEVARLDIGFDPFAQATAGVGFITVADLLGNHRLSFTGALGGQTFRASDVVVAYQYLPRRVDWQAVGYHIGNFLVRDNRLVFDRRFGGSLSASIPLSQFTRFEAGAETFSLSRGFWNDLVEGLPAYPFVETDILRPRLAWVNDNSLFSLIGPAAGRRLRADLAYVPPVFQDTFSYVQADADLRQYWIFGKQVTLAGRLSVGFSEALAGYDNPHAYLAGGDNLVPLFYFPVRSENAPDNLLEFAFQELALPVRGLPYYASAGNRMAIANAELRFPFITDLQVRYPLPLRLRSLMGTVFADYGGAWSAAGRYDLDWDSIGGNLGLGTGYGLRLNLGIFVLRYSRGYAWDFGSGDGVWRSYWSAGAVF